MRTINNKKTALNWAKSLNIKFIDIAGFPSQEYFDRVMIPVDDFIGRAACSTIEKPPQTNRRDASRKLREINRKIY